MAVDIEEEESSSERLSKTEQKALMDIAPFASKNIQFYRL